MIAYWVLAAAVVAAPNVPTQRYEDVQVGAVALRVPFPDGYCKPSGDDIAAHQVLAAGDNQNVTLLSLIECKRNPATNRYLLVKSPLMALNTSLDRAVTLSEMAAEMGTSKFSDSMGDIQEQIGAGKTAVTGVPTKVSGEVGPRGHDDSCVYVGGLMTTSAQDMQQTQAVGACLTVIGHRFVSLNAYVDSTNPEGYKALFPQLKKWSAQIGERP